MKQEERAELLRELETIMQDIINHSNGETEKYDKMTQEVSKVISEIKTWNNLQLKLFEIYFKIMKSQ